MPRDTTGRRRCSTDPIKVARTNKLCTYQLLEKLGEGTYGRVYKAINKFTKKYVALKQVKLDPNEEGIPATTLREISILKRLKHPTLVNLEGQIYEQTIAEKNRCKIEYEKRKHQLTEAERMAYERKLTKLSVIKLYLVFEYMPFDLRAFLDKRPGRKLDERLLRRFTGQLLQSVYFCHAHRIMHRDLKPQNFLVDAATMSLKLCDFGLGREHGLPLKKLTHEVVTLWYRPPEILLGAEVYSAAVDMWGVGAIVVEMATGKALFPGDSEIDQLFQIFKILGTPNERTWPGVTQLENASIVKSGPKWPPKNLYSVIPELCLDGHELLSALLRYAPSQRICAKEALSHPYLLGVDLVNWPPADRATGGAAVIG